MQLDTFSDAVESAQNAFFLHDQPSFVAALERAKTAVPADSAAAFSLSDAEKFFPAPDALKMVMRAVSEVLELHRLEVRQRVLQDRPGWPYTSFETDVRQAVPTG